MSLIYRDRQPVEIEAGHLYELLRFANPVSGEVALDTEASGLFVDGDWQDGPPARVSVVSLAWQEYEHCDVCYTESMGLPEYAGFKHHPQCSPKTAIGDGQILALRSLALPFDQGRIGGKPGRWSDELGTYETLPHTVECQITSGRDSGNWVCQCAPWNLNRTDWEALGAWLADKRVTMHNDKYDLHIMNAGLRKGVDGFSNRMSGINLVNQVAWDTMLGQQLIDPLERSGLKPTAERLWGEDSRNEERAVAEALKKNGVGLTKRYDLVDWSVMGPYAAVDAELVVKLKEYQFDCRVDGEITDTKWQLIRDEIELMKTLYRMELRRVGVDIEEMRRAAVAMEKHIAQLESDLPWIKNYGRTLSNVAGVAVTNPGALLGSFKRPSKPKGEPKANISWAKWWFFGLKAEGALELMPVKTTDKGACTLDTEVIARFAAEGVPGAEQWQDIAKCNSALSKWYRAWPEKAVQVEEGQWRLMTNYRQGKVESDRKGMNSGGAISGRLSAERIQLQGFPDDYKIPSFVKGPKKLLQGKKDYCFECGQVTQYELDELDISNAEVRVAAWLMQSPSLAKACMSGNVHSANTVMMAEALGMLKSFPGGWPEGMAPDAWWLNEDGSIKLDKEGKRQYYLEQHPEWSMYRKVMKTTVLGLFFGAGIRTLKRQIEMATGRDFPERDVKRFRDLTLAVIPEWQNVSRRMQRKADKSLGGVGYIRLVNGRERWFGWGEQTHKAFNSGTQGGVAETMKTFMRWVDAHYGDALVNQVHDSLWLELCPCSSERKLKEIKAYGEKLFTETFSTPDLHIDFELDSKRLA